MQSSTASHVSEERNSCREQQRIRLEFKKGTKNVEFDLTTKQVQKIVKGGIEEAELLALVQLIQERASNISGAGFRRLTGKNQKSSVCLVFCSLVAVLYFMLLCVLYLGTKEKAQGCEVLLLTPFVFCLVGAVGDRFLPKMRQNKGRRSLNVAERRAEEINELVRAINNAKCLKKHISTNCSYKALTLILRPRERIGAQKRDLWSDVDENEVKLHFESLKNKVQKRRLKGVKNRPLSGLNSKKKAKYEHYSLLVTPMRPEELNFNFSTNSQVSAINDQLDGSRQHNSDPSCDARSEQSISQASSC